MLNYSIHTFELRLEVKPCEIRKIRDWLYSKSIPIKKYDDGTLNVLSYANRGVRIKFIPNNYKPHFAFIINLREVLENGNLVDLIDPVDVEEAINQVNGMIVNFFGVCHNIDTLKLCRIDCCVNISVGSQEAVDTYLKLLNYKLGNAKGYKVKNINSPNRYCKNEFRAENGKSGIVLSIYNKMAQLLSINRKAEAERAEGILRLEVQLKRHSTITQLLSQELSNSEIIKRAVLHSREIISMVLFKVIPRGNYHKLDDAIELVNCNIARKKMRQRMIRLLEFSSKLHSISLAKDKLFSEDKKLSEGYYRDMLAEFSDLNLNIVTLGRRCKFSYLKGLGEFIREQTMNS